ncbi:MAG: hypothetical protein ACUVTD_07210 [Nitrososphaerales archaeon]
MLEQHNGIVQANRIHPSLEKMEKAIANRIGTRRFRLNAMLDAIDVIL